MTDVRVVIDPSVTFDPRTYDFNAPIASSVVSEEVDVPKEEEAEPLPKREASNETGGSMEHQFEVTVVEKNESDQNGGIIQW